VSEDNNPATGSGWLDRRVDRKMRKRQLERMDDREKLQYKIKRRDDRDALTRQRMDKLASATKVVITTGPIMAPMAVAWTGQAGFAMKVIGWTFPAAIVYAAAYELTTAFCGWMYHEARKDGDTGLEYRFATWAFASGSATQQWWHYSDHWSATPRSVTFASMTMIGLIVWELYARLIHRRELRKNNMRSKPMPKLGVVRWVRFPRLAWSAWSEMIRTGSRDLDRAWSVVESRRTSRWPWSKERSAPLVQPDRTSGPQDVAPDQPGPLPEWAVQRLDQPDQSGPDHAELTGAWPGPDQDRTPEIEQPDQVPELEASPVSKPVRPIPTADSFEPLEIERRAIRYMIDNDIRINRRNVGEVIRTHEGFKVAINTTRAGQVAAWGRSQDSSDGHLKAV
jgi:hypothetical protein